MFNGTSYLYKVPNLPSFTAKYPFRQLDLLISNLSTQPTHFASCQLNPPSFFHVDMFPLTANFLFFGRVALCPKSTPSQESLVFKPFSYIYFSTFDINTTHSTDATFSLKASMTSLLTGNAYFISFIGFFPSSHVSFG